MRGFAKRVRGGAAVGALAIGAALAAAGAIGASSVAAHPAADGAARAAQAPTERAPIQAETGTAREMAYGTDRLQRLDYYAPARAGAPLMVFIHGGGWRMGDKGGETHAAKVRHMLALGYAFASINYRLVPDATVEEQGADVASALAYLVRHARALGFDPDRIVVMGHSAGAHLAALIGTDPQYLHRVGLDVTRLAGVVLLDGAGYDVPRQMADGPGLTRRMYADAFGSDPARQRALSPLFHVEAPNAPSFLILHVQRPDGIRQSRELAAALERAGTRVRIEGVPGEGLRGHRDINVHLGDATQPATAILDQWLHATVY